LIASQYKQFASKLPPFITTALGLQTVRWLCMRLMSDCEGHARCCTCAVRESFTHGDAIAMLSGGFDRADMCPTTAKSAQATKHIVCNSPYGTGRVKSRRGNLERLKLTRLGLPTSRFLGFPMSPPHAASNKTPSHVSVTLCRSYQRLQRGDVRQSILPSRQNGMVAIKMCYRNRFDRLLNLQSTSCTPM
jgi:hypothetical protein